MTHRGKMGYFVFGNYGDNTIAVIQWFYNKGLKPVTVINVDTGWGDATWDQRIYQGQTLAKKYGFKTVTLTPPHDFQELIRDRQSFPSAKFQWCSTFLKALPLLNWLDEVDPGCEGVIVLGSRRYDSRARQNLPEFIEQSEHYGSRKLWHPLFDSTHEMRDALIQQTGLKVLNTRSLECSPCIYSSLTEINALSEKKLLEIGELEKEVDQTMFHARFPLTSIEKLANHSKAGDSVNLEAFDMGCGSHYACGE